MRREKRSLIWAGLLLFVAALALVNLAFGVSCYAVAFFFVRDRPRNFYFYSTLAMVLLLTSGPLLLAQAEEG